MDRAEKRRREKQARKAAKAKQPGQPAPDQPAGDASQATGKATGLHALFDKAVQAHQAGQFSEADAAYRQILDADPGHADANHLLGVLALQTGNHEAAVQLIERAIAANPAVAAFHANLGVALKERGRFEDAAASQRKAIGLQPDFADAHFNLGNALVDLNRLEEAAAAYRAAIRIKPDFAEAHGNLGNALHRMGRPEDAAECCRAALKIRPDFAEVLNLLGNALHDLGRGGAAAQSYRDAIKIKPEFPEALSNLGILLQEAGRLDDAAACHQKALALRPGFAEAHHNLANAFKDSGSLEDAVKHYFKAVALNPDYADAWTNLNFAAKALSFLETEAGRGFDFGAFDSNETVRGSADYALLDYYLAKFRPHEAEKSFRKAMAALPPMTGEALTIEAAEGAAEDMPAFSNAPVALLHFGRSGTGLLHSLIDGHPEISTLPGTYLQGYFNPGVWDALAAGGWRELPDRFADMFQVLFDANSPNPVPARPREAVPFLGQREGMTRVGEDRDETLTLDRDAFRAEALKRLSGLEIADPMSFLMVVHAAYEAVTGGDGEKNTVFYHFHNPDDFAKLNFLRYAPEARLLMMVREPVESLESWIRRMVRAGDCENIVQRILAMLFAVDQVAFRAQDAVGVRLEDVKARPEETMQALCGWLGVEEDPCLYEMTAQGKKWWGDPSSPDYDEAKGMAPFADAATRQPRKQLLSNADRRIFQTLFYPFSVRFGYREPDPEGFRADLNRIRPQLDDLLDFEKTIADRAGMEPERLKKTNACLLLRAGLRDRWNVLDERGDYPGMLKPLPVG